LKLQAFWFHPAVLCFAQPFLLFSDTFASLEKEKRLMLPMRLLFIQRQHEEDESRVRERRG
jgi:hypothetical protein